MNEVEVTNEDNFFGNQSIGPRANLYPLLCALVGVRSLDKVTVHVLYREKLQCRRAGFTTGNYRGF